MVKHIVIYSREGLYREAIKEGVYAHPNFQNDFLKTGSGEVFGRTDKYFFKIVPIFGGVELRFWTKSKRISISVNMTIKRT